MFCLLDGWHGLTIEDIRELEEAVKRELDQKLDKLGMKTTDEEKAPGSIRSTPY